VTPGSFPASIGRYRIEALLGKGGMGEVYKAFDASLDRTVALKTIAPDADNPVFLERLYREAKACGRLRHPHIVTVYDLGEIDGVVFIAMEYLEGENLQAAMNRGDLSFQQKIEFLIQILEALQYAHSEGVIHRDIKPSNVHVMTDGKTLKLLDFGLARVARAESLTMSGAVMGTPYYMSPEQLKGHEVDGRTDVYATGVVAYELLTRRRAFDGENITTVMLKVLTDPPPPMATAWSHAFPEIERIVNRALAKNADERYATAEDMRNALSNFLSTSRAAIVNAQAEMTVYSQRAVAEAKTLLADGKVAESEQLLASTLVNNPDAHDVRQLLQQVTQIQPAQTVPATKPVAGPQPAPPPVMKTEVAPPRPPAPAPARPAQPSPAPRPAAVRQPVVAAPVAPQPLVAQAASAPVAGGSKSSRWFGVIAAVVGVAIVALVMTQRGTAPPGPPASATAAAQPSAPTATATATGAGTPVVTQTQAPPVAPGASNPAAPPAQPPAAAPPSQASVAGNAPASSVSQTVAARPSSTPSGAAPAGQSSIGGAAQPPAGGGQRGGPRDMRMVAVDAANTDAGLRAELTNAIKARNLTVGAAGAAHLEISARVQVSVRPSQLGGSSAMTADYVTTLQIRNLVTGARDTQMFDGHALEFGEPVVRQAALRRAAEQVAEAIEAAVGN
jgi:serine/threonine-protein kinase